MLKHGAGARGAHTNTPLAHQYPPRVHGLAVGEERAALRQPRHQPSFCKPSGGWGPLRSYKTTPKQRPRVAATNKISALVTQPEKRLRLNGALPKKHLASHVSC